MRILQSVACAAVAVALLAGAASALPVDGEKKVDVTDQGFSPDKVEVKVGEKVVWKNTTQKEHTVTAEEKKSEAPAAPMFDSGLLKPGAVFEYTFEKAGTYSYHSTLDKAFKGTVVVK